MRVIRVLHIITGLSIGGAEMMLYKLLSRMDQSKFHTMVISLREVGKIGERIRGLGIRVEALKIDGKLPGISSMAKLVKFTRQFKPHLLQGWMYHGNLAAQFASMFLPDKILVLWNIRHSPYDLNDEKPMTANLIRFGAYFSGRPKFVLYNSKVSVRLHEKIGYSRSKNLVVPNGFDTELFVPSATARLEVRRELGLLESATLIGLIARYDPMKDHQNFIRAAAYLFQSHRNVHFLLAGRGVDRDNNDLMKLISELQLQENMHLLGERSDIPRLTASLDLASSSSYGEGFPNAIGEAMSCGVPCVVTDVGDSPYVVGDTGQVVPPKEPIKLAEAWRKLLDLPEGKLVELGMNARKRIEENFSLDSIVARYGEVYETSYMAKALLS